MFNYPPYLSHPDHMYHIFNVSKSIDATVSVNGDSKNASSLTLMFYM